MKTVRLFLNEPLGKFALGVCQSFASREEALVFLSEAARQYAVVLDRAYLPHLQDDPFVFVVPWAAVGYILVENDGGKGVAA